MTIEQIVIEYLRRHKNHYVTEGHIETRLPLWANENYGIYHIGSSYTRLFRKVRDILNDIECIEVKEDVLGNKFKWKTWLIKERGQIETGN